MSLDVFPRRNLPPESEPWGRKHDEVSRSHTRTLEDIRLSLLGLNRASAGQLGVVGRQLDELERQQLEIEANVAELQARSTHFDSPANLSVTGNATTAPFPSATRNFSFPAPTGGRRAAVLTFSWDYTNSGSSTVSAYADIRQGSTIIWQSPQGQSVPWGASAPPGWSPGASGLASVRVPAGGSTFSLRIHRVGFQTTTTTLSATNISAVLQYVDRY